LNDTLFSFENGRRGYWEPYSFFRDTGCNIYFLHPHDPAKIPVLFVHGAMGSPRGWRFLSRHMDSSRFQPWFYYYPSGAPLQCAADLLHRKLVALRDRHRFDRMVIVAHSMGGLVVRSALVHHHGDLSFVRAFISIATPWDGVSRVVPGINISPVVLPSWKDLQPDGPFARSIFCRDLPESVDHYLFFGFKQGGRSEWGSDGVVGLTTQLKPRSQREAAGIFGFHEDHSGMLRSFSVLERFNRVLDKAWNDRPAGT
jgi:pimeloyl-ACP methyl ester carboxylesterase